MSEHGPCPFCGGKAASFFHRDRGMGDSWHVECLAELCGNSTCFHDDEAQAIAAWNQRTDLSARIIARERDGWHRPAHRAVMASVKLGAWMSAALDDPNVCEAMKADINEWFSAGEPMETLYQALEAQGDLASRIIARADQVLTALADVEGDYFDGFREAWREARLMARGE